MRIQDKTLYMAKQLARYIKPRISLSNKEKLMYDLFYLALLNLSLNCLKVFSMLLKYYDCNDSSCNNKNT